MNYLLIRLEAPLMSFGGTIIDANGKTLPFPSKSLLVGLLGNALGYDYHRAQDLELLNRLQNRMNYAVRIDIEGTIIEDYQTVDLSTPHMLDKHAWTTQGFLDKREGGNSEGTHIRLREYIADACYLVAISLYDLEDAHAQYPSLDQLKEALIKPARPLFIGRKPCLPASPLFVGIEMADDFKSLFAQYPCLKRTEMPVQSTAIDAILKPKSEDLWAWLPLQSSDYQKLTSRDKVMHLVDHRDFKNQIFGGSRMMHRVKITL